MPFELSNYVALQVRDYDKAVAFYRDTLGMELVKYTESESKFKANDRYFFIERKDDTPRRTYFEFCVESIDAAVKELSEAGCQVLWKYSDKSYGFEDPYGMCFHVYERGAQLPDL